MKVVSGSFLSAFSLILLSLFNVSTASAINGLPTSWRNLAIQRSIDVTKSYVKEVLDIRARNIDSVPVDKYYLPLPKSQINDYALILGSHGLNGELLLPVSVYNDTTSEFDYLEFRFPAPLAPGSDVKFQFQSVYLHHLQPIPDQLDLNGVQSLVLKTYKYPVSPYVTENYDLHFAGIRGGISDLNAGKNQDSQLPRLKQFEFARGLLSFKPDTREESFEIPPFAAELAAFKFERNLPLPVAEKLSRDIWVSHWGDSVSFEESYEITNKVGKLKGGFSRLEWMKSQYQQQPGPHLLVLDMELPKNFREAYYVDLVGNVSTSKIIRNHLVLKPRYPIFGGWNYNFTIGWTNDLKDFVRKSDDERDTYLVKVPLLNGHKDMAYNSVDYSFYLPEGAQLLDIAATVPYENYTVGTEKSYLDLNGHTKVTIHYKNLVDAFGDSSVIVKYKYTLNDHYKKPVLVSAFLFLALISYLLLTKVDVAISDQKQQPVVAKVKKVADVKEAKH